jgi:Tn3 transposase DDE domain
MLDWLESPDLRRRCQAGLNKSEQRHSLAQVTCTFKQGNRNAARTHHLLEIAIAHFIAAIPPDRPEHHLTLEVAPLEVRHAQFPTSRRTHPDAKCRSLQQSRIVYGLLCAADGCPVAIEVFDGNTGDPKTLATHSDKLKGRFSLAHVVLLVGLQPTGLSRADRGMITQARIREDVIPANLDWITALRGRLP